MEPDRLTAGLRRLAGRDLARSGIHEALQESAEACAAIFGVSGSGIMLADDQDVSRFVAASDVPGRVLETAEIASGEGPCMTAFAELKPVTTDDVCADPRWPRLAAAVAGHGVHAVLGAPVRLGGVTVGTVDLYRDRPGSWSEVEVEGLQRYAGIVARILGSLLEAERAEELAGQLQYALDHRVVVERAVGYLMAREGHDAVTAFDVLRTTARSSRRKIGDVAAELLGGGPGA